VCEMSAIGECADKTARRDQGRDES